MLMVKPKFPTGAIWLIFVIGLNFVSPLVTVWVALDGRGGDMIIFPIVSSLIVSPVAFAAGAICFFLVENLTQKIVLAVLSLANLILFLYVLTALRG